MDPNECELYGVLLLIMGPLISIQHIYAVSIISHMQIIKKHIHIKFAFANLAREMLKIIISR